VILLLGAGFRIYTYAGNRSLWLDEAMMALNILSRSPHELLQPLDYVQFAPSGWLVLTDLVQSWLGGLELSLRLPSLLAGLATLGVAAFIALRSFDRFTAAFVCLLIAGSPYLVRYSAELKPYGWDAFLTLAIYALSWSMLHTRRFTWQGLGLLLLVGAVAIPLSNAVAFMLGGAGAVLFFAALSTRDWRASAATLAISAAWLAEFLTLYLGLYTPQISGFAEGVQSDFVRLQHYAPFPPLSLSELAWYPKSALELFIFLFNRPSVFPAAATYLMGALWLLRRDASTLALLTLPIGAAVVASMLHAYPFDARFLLFTAPLVFVTVGYGIGAIVERFRGALMPAATIAGLIVIPVVAQTLGYLAVRPAPFAHEEIKPALSDLASRRQEGDVIYLFYNTQPAFDLYKDRFGLADATAIYGLLPESDWSCYLYDVKRVTRNSRVWLVYSHLTDEYGMDEVKFFSYFAGLYGTLLWSKDYPGAALRLFAFDLEAATRADQTLPIGDATAREGVCHILQR
jgi:hypothetical protein